MSIEKIYWPNEELINEIRSFNNNTSAYLKKDWDNFFKVRMNQCDDIGLKFDTSCLERIKGKPSTETEDAWLIYSSIHGMTPRLACQPNPWAFLTSKYLLDYGINRWLSNAKKQSDTDDKIKKYFLNFNRGNLRDFHVSSRPWWTIHIASKIANSTKKEDVFNILKVISRTTDETMNSIQRITLFSDLNLARYIVSSGAELSSNREQGYRSLLKKANYITNGKLVNNFDQNDFEDLFS